jgi:serine/threonine-protein kinase
LEADSVAQLAAHLHKEPEPLSTASPAPVPPALERVIRRSMAKDPAERYPSTRAVLDELQLISFEEP